MIDQLSHGGLRRSGISVLIAAALTLAAFGLPARADDPRHNPRQSAEAGEIVPLEQLLARIRRDYGGRVLKVELEGEDREDEARWVYEVKVLTPEGNVQQDCFSSSCFVITLNVASTRSFTVTLKSWWPPARSLPRAP